MATSHELLQAALQRSARRNTWVARRRLAWRWLIYLAGWTLRFILPPAALAAAVAWWWLQPADGAERLGAPGPAAAASRPLSAADRPAASSVVAASQPPAAEVSLPDNAPVLHLRFDDEARRPAVKPGNPRLPLPAPEPAQTGRPPEQEQQ